MLMANLGKMDIYIKTYQVTFGTPKDMRCINGEGKKKNPKKDTKKK